MAARNRIMLVLLGTVDEDICYHLGDPFLSNGTTFVKKLIVGLFLKLLLLTDVRMKGEDQPVMRIIDTEYSKWNSMV